jgi:hypothetical protein
VSGVLVRAQHGTSAKFSNRDGRALRRRRRNGACYAYLQEDEDKKCAENQGAAEGEVERTLSMEEGSGGRGRNFTFHIEKKLEVDKSDLKKALLEFADCLENMALAHNEHFRSGYHKKSGDSGTKNKGDDCDGGCSPVLKTIGKNLGGQNNSTIDPDRTNFGNEKLSDSTVTGEKSNRKPRPRLNTKKCTGENNYFLTVTNISMLERSNSCLLYEHGAKRESRLSTTPSPCGGGLYKDSCSTALFPLENIASTCSHPPKF